jgi:hypothetical protein
MTLLLSGILYFTACNNEIEPEINIIPEGRIMLNLPEANVLTYSTATPSECYIDSLWVLEFNGTAYVHDTVIPGAGIANNGQATQMLPQIRFAPTTNRIILLANFGMHNLATIRGSVSPTNINALLPLTKPYYVEGDHLPMYGEIASWNPTGGPYDCAMIRAVAKIQLKLGETFVSYRPFTGLPDRATFLFYNYAPQGQIQPQPTVTGIPAAAPKSFTANIKLVQGAQQTLPATVYVYEYPSATKNILGTTIADNSFNIDRPFLLLADSTSSGGFYRLDFYDSHPTEKKFVDIKRNCHYIVTINKQNTAGYMPVISVLSWRDPTINNPGSNIEYIVEVRDGSNVVVSNGQYAIVCSTDTAYVEAGASNVTIATARYQLGVGMPPLAEVMNNSQYSGTPSGSMIFISPDSLTSVNQNVVITTTAAFTSGSVGFNLGNMFYNIVVLKK